MEKFLGWYSDDTCKRFETLEEALNSKNHLERPIRYTCEMYVNDEYIGEYDLSFEDFFKKYEKSC